MASTVPIGTRDYVVQKHDNDQRADQIAARSWPDISRAQIRLLARTGNLQLDQKRIAAGTRVVAGQLLSLHLPAQGASNSAQSPLLLHETDDILFVFKPEAWHSVALRPQQQGCLTTWLALQRPDLAYLPESGLLHRLDQPTSGVMAVAKSMRAYEQGRTAFSQRDGIRKSYLALVDGQQPLANTDAPPKAELRTGDCMQVTAAIDRGSDASRVAIRDTGRQAHSFVRVLASDLLGDENAYALCCIDISTGARHQIRIHLAHLGFPIVGDVLYGGQAAPRLYLHACHLDLRRCFGDACVATYLADGSFWRQVSSPEQVRGKSLTTEYLAQSAR